MECVCAKDYFTCTLNIKNCIMFCSCMQLLDVYLAMLSTVTQSVSMVNHFLSLCIKFGAEASYSVYTACIIAMTTIGTCSNPCANALQSVKWMAPTAVYLWLSSSQTDIVLQTMQYAPVSDNKPLACDPAFKEGLGSIPVAHV